MKRSLSFVATLAWALGCGGGGAPPASPSDAPTIELQALQDNATISDDVSVTVIAKGNQVNITSLVFDEPDELKAATATVDDATHTATLTGDLHARTGEYKVGALRVSATARDEAGHQTTRQFTFNVAAAAGKIHVDDTFASFQDEAGIQAQKVNGLALPGGYQYVSNVKVAVKPGVAITKVSNRLGWIGATPTAADLRTNPDNLPILRLVVPQDAPAAITSAKAAVTVGTGTPVDVDLTPDTVSPKGEPAFLLPLASNLFPDLENITEAKIVSVTATTRDSLGRSAQGGPWPVTLTPIPPPLIVSPDASYASTADPLSVYPYTGKAYATLWGQGFSVENGVRVVHLVVSNPAPTPVSLGSALTSSRWDLSETWLAHHDAGTYSSTSYYGSWTTSNGGGYTASGTYPCDPRGTVPVSYQAVGSSSWSCKPSSVGDGPAAQTMPRTGALALTAYVAGTTSAASRSGSRFIVPAATFTPSPTPGVLDVYVIRPLSDRTDALPLTNWNGTAYEAGTSYTTRQVTSAEAVSSGCTGYSGTLQSCTKYTWTTLKWDWALGSVTETISGSLSLDAQAFDEADGASHGPVGSILPKPQDLTLPKPISH